MLFNKSNDQKIAIEEVRKYLPIIDKLQAYEYLEADLSNAIFDLGKIVGDDIVALAEEYYETDTPADASGSGDGGFDSAKFVERVQAAVVAIGYRNFCMSNDVSHETTGRKAIVDAKNQKQAWEFMIERDNVALSNRMHKSITMLIDFLNKEKPQVWTGSIIYRDIKAVLLSDIYLFQRYFHIDDSQLLYIKLLPLQRRAQNSHVIPILGKTRFDALKDDLIENGLDNDETAALLDKVGPILAYRAIADGIKIFSVKLLPEGLVQQFSSSIQNRSASMPVPGREKDYVVSWLNTEIKNYEFELGEYVAKLAEESGTADPDEVPYTMLVERNTSDNKYFSV